MTTEPSWWRSDEHGVLLDVHVVPGASTDEVAGLHGGRLRVRVRAPAVEGKANTALCRFIAKELGVRRTAITVVRGERSRDKTLRIVGYDATLAEATLWTRWPDT